MNVFRVIVGQLIALAVCAPIFAEELYSTASSGHKVNVLDPNSGELAEFASFEDALSRGIAFEPNGKLYVTTYFEDHSVLEELDREFGTRTTIGRFEGETFVQSIDFDYQGNLYALSTAGELLRMDRDVGAPFRMKPGTDVLDMTDVGDSGVLDSTDLAIDLAGRVFAIAGRDLYQVDPFTAQQLSMKQVVIVSPEEIPPPAEEDAKAFEVGFQVDEPTFAGLAFDQGGTLYATSNTCPTLVYEVDPETGNAFFVSQTDMCDPCSGDFPPVEYVGTGIGSFWGGSSSGGNYTLGGPLGVAGGAFGGGIGGYGGGGGIGGGTNNNPGGDPDGPDVTPVPEPGTLSIFGLGLAGLGVARFLRRRAREKLVPQECC